MSGIKNFFDTIMGSTRHKNEPFMQRAVNPRASIAYSVDVRSSLDPFKDARGILDEAINEYSEAVRQKPDYAEAHYHLGIALDDKGLLDDAIREFREAVRLNPEFYEAHFNLGAAMDDKGMLDEAISDYRESLRLNPDEAKAK